MELPVVAQPPTNPHYTRLGGHGVVQQLVAAFYRQMSTRPDAAGIWRMHRRDMNDVQRVLVAYLSEWLGGPRLYSPERGPPRLGRVHAGLAIGGAERDAWMACMRAALDEVSTDAALKAELERAFAKVAQHLTHAHSPSHPTTAGAHP